MRKTIWLWAGSVAGILLLVVAALAQEARQNKHEVPREVLALQGTYTGEWTMYGIDAKGQVVPRMAWKDTEKAEKPTVEGDRAFVTGTDEMIFEGGRIPPRKYTMTEGYLLNKDGSLGDYFMDSGGQVTRMTRLDKDTWVYTAKADPREMASAGFTNVQSARHVLVKVITSEQGKETHRISRLTTIHWKDAEGKDRWLQYTSLQGFHIHQPL